MSGCAGSIKHMSSVHPNNIASAPYPGMAMVIFMRPSTLGFAIQSSVYEIRDSEPSLIGIVAANTKVVHHLEPGTHLFMVIGESADFMSADLEANKTYYALVTPRMGMWKARFSLKPVKKEELESKDFNEWVKSCNWVEKDSSSVKWEAEHLKSIRSLQGEYYVKWMQKSEADRPRLAPDDGI